MQILEMFRITAGLCLKDIFNILNEIVQHSKYLVLENNTLAMTMIMLFVETSIAQTLNRGHGKSRQQIILILCISHDKE
jgi:hypothetical protein